MVTGPEFVLGAVPSKDDLGRQEPFSRYLRVPARVARASHRGSFGGWRVSHGRRNLTNSADEGFPSEQFRVCSYGLFETGLVNKSSLKSGYEARKFVGIRLIETVPPMVAGRKLRNKLANSAKSSLSWVTGGVQRVSKGTAEIERCAERLLVEPVVVNSEDQSESALGPLPELPGALDVMWARNDLKPQLGETRT